MKNLISLTILCLMVITTGNLFAQKKADPTDVTKEEVEFKKGDLEVSFGVGLLSTFVSKGAKTKILPVSVMLNYRIKQYVSVGTYAGFSSTNGYLREQKTNETPITSPVLRNDFFVFGARLEGHFNRERVDFYGGAMLSYSMSNVRKLNPDIDRVENIIIEEGKQGKFIYSGYVGMKYMVTKHLGFFGEIGYSVSLINIGLSSKF